MKISESGKFALIERLTSRFEAEQSASTKISNDASIVNPTNDCVLVSSDMLFEGIDFNLTYVPLKHLGFKVVTTGVSSLVAMNARPLGIRINAGVSARFSVEDIELLFDGINAGCIYYNINLTGCDIKSSMTGMVIGVTTTGKADPKDTVFRNGAQINDLICISGDLGSAYAGLLLLERERRIFETNFESKPQLEGYDYVLRRQLQPYAVTDMAAMFKECGIKPSSMIDITDGLASELLHICNDSNKGAVIFSKKIPIASETVKVCNEMNLSAITAAVNGGDDYELLFTVPSSAFEKIKGLAGFEIIGYITEPDKGVFLVTPEYRVVELKAQGWSGEKND